MGAGYGNPPRMFEPPVEARRTSAGPAKKHRRWVLHSHEATKPSMSGSVSEINITPLIDVLLVLLIIFMVVTPVAQKGLDIALPQPAPANQPNQPQAPSTQIVLALDDTGISVNKSPVSNLEELEGRLRDIFQTKSDKTMFVRASGKVVYGQVVSAMDVAKAAGVERIGIISEKMIEDAGGIAEGTPTQ